MRLVSVALVGLAAFVASPDFASAAGICGYGWKLVGRHQCVPSDEPPLYYNNAAPYDRGYGIEKPPRDDLPHGEPFGLPIMGRCVQGFTVQDGICKPYRGG